MGTRLRRAGSPCSGCCVNLTDLHRRLLADVLAVGGAYPLALTGGYAVQAHGLVDRLSQDLNVATENPDRVEDIDAAARWPGTTRLAGQRSGSRPALRTPDRHRSRRSREVRGRHPQGSAPATARTHRPRSRRPCGARTATGGYGRCLNRSTIPHSTTCDSWAYVSFPEAEVRSSRKPRNSYDTGSKIRYLLL